MDTDLGMITCSVTQNGRGDLAEILRHLRGVIDLHWDELQWLLKQGESRIKTFGPFIGRSLTELTLTAHLARLDPFRVLYLREMQRQPGFDISFRRAASIQWHGDVLAKEPPAKSLWDPERGFEKISRALLGDYYEHIIWRNAFVQMLDDFKNADGGAWLNELRSIDPEDFGPRMRFAFTGLYSSLSKGIHHEFVIPPGALYDKSVILTLLAETIKHCAHISIVSHFVEHCPFVLAPQDALDCYVRLQSLMVSL